MFQTLSDITSLFPVFDEYCEEMFQTLSDITSFLTVLKEYCEDEMFQARCSDDQVIVMQTAR